MLRQQILTHAINALTLLVVSTVSVMFVRSRKANSSSETGATSVDKVPGKFAFVSDIFGVFLALSLTLSLISYIRSW